MKDQIVVCILGAIAILILIFSDFGRNTVVRYDCRDAHWHPDVPIEVKKECAKLFYDEWKRKENERKNEDGIHESRSDLLRT
jgi:hypothetical protein